MTPSSIESSAPRIRIAAAIITNANGQLLLVRKRGTRFFMQPGGKLRPGETSRNALRRELLEELGCKLEHAHRVGVFLAPAANEPQHFVEAALFRTTVLGEIRPAAEIEELLWLSLPEAGKHPLAPLTRDHVIPIVSSITAFIRSGI